MSVHPGTTPQASSFSLDEGRQFLTPEQAESLIPDGEYVHNYAGGGSMVFGCDYERAEAIEAFRKAAEIEIGGPSCRAIRHPICVREESGRVTFFEADMAKLEAFEAEMAGIVAQ